MIGDRSIEEVRVRFFSFFFSFHLHKHALSHHHPLADSSVEVARLVPGRPLDVAPQRPLDRLLADLCLPGQNVLERRAHVRARRGDFVPGPRIVKLPMVIELARGIKHVELGRARRAELLRDLLRLVEEVAEARVAVPEFFGVLLHRRGAVLRVRLDGVGADSYDLDALWGVVFGEGDERVLEEDDEGTVVALISVKKNEETERGEKKGWFSE